MEITLLSFIYSQPFIIIFICCALAFVVVRFSSNGSRKSSISSDLSGKCVCNGVVLKSLCSSDSMGAVSNGVVSMMERQTGASMMEQLDFTVEQDTLVPANGWKAYYAATRAIVNVNAEFFNIVRERALPAMRRFWLKADYVKCIHASGEIFSGYNAVMGSWQIAFNWEHEDGNFQVRDVRARVLSDMAWVSLKTYVDMDAEPYNVTNVFEYHEGRWYMVHHHCSVMLVDGDVGQHAVHA
ncbi:hypothetical protein KSS87_020011 [Heliosperma pusillum]|nr:hypothetical protein KSS87_020011 [Heliosperma pusillum]